MVELEAEQRVDAEHALSSVDVAIHSETLRDTAPVLEGIKVRESHTHTHTKSFIMFKKCCSFAFCIHKRILKKKCLCFCINTQQNNCFQH